MVKNWDNISQSRLVDRDVHLCTIYSIYNEKHVCILSVLQIFVYKVEYNRKPTMILSVSIYIV